MLNLEDASTEVIPESSNQNKSKPNIKKMASKPNIMTTKKKESI